MPSSPKKIKSEIRPAGLAVPDETSGRGGAPKSVSARSPSRKDKRKRILIIDDHPMIREGLRGTINAEDSLEVCGECDHALKALDMLKALQPDLVLMDITLPGKSGLELLRDIRVACPSVPVLVLSMHDESLYAERALRAGAGGYINKQQPPQALLAAIHAVADGRIHVSKQVNECILLRLAGRNSGSGSPLENLTDREFEIFQLIGEGKATGQIARQLHLSPKTIAVHYANIKLATYADLIRFAVRQEESRNLVPPGAASGEGAKLKSYPA
jgi:DNA-binding NarL/FixJ family response regulator